MADNEAEGAADGAEAAPSKKGKLKLIIAVVGFVAILGAGAGWFFFMRGHGDEAHAEAPPPKPPSFVEVPDMMVNLVGAAGERVQYLKVKIVLEVKEEKQVEAIKPSCRASPTCSRPICANCAPPTQRLGRPVPAEGRADQARQSGAGAANGERGAVQGNHRPVTHQVSIMAG
jgi:Flagellar basal body-associated protein